MPVQLAWSRHGGDDCVRLTGWSPRALAAFTALDDRERARRVLVLPGGLVERRGSATPDARPVAGSLRLTPANGRFVCETDGVSFVPRFPFLAGNRYAVLVHRSLDDDGADRSGAGAGAGGTFDLDDYAQLSIRAPIRARAPSTRVVAITPSAGAVPRNLLRCYVEFSAPMSEGEAADHVALVDRDTQVPVAGALLALDPELWDPARRRLTVLLDPARIKRGLVPHREAGYALHEGARVELVVDRQFRDADGQPLVGEARRAYVVGPDVRARIDAGRWAIGRPAAGGREALTVDFGRVLDRALLDHCVVVVDDAGRAIDGSATVANGETSWTFTPAEPWSAVRHAVVIDAMLEDVAGNSVVRVFDRDLADDSHTPTPGGHVTVEFTPEPARR